MSDRLLTLLPELDTVRRQYRAARTTLDAMLPPSSIPADTSDYLMSLAEEYGVDHTMSLVRNDPKHFDLSVVPQQLETALTKAYEASLRVDELVAERESILATANPTHVRHYALQGREFIFDLPNKRVVFVDGPEVAAIPAALAIKPRRVKSKLKPTGSPEKDRSR